MYGMPERARLQRGIAHETVVALNFLPDMYGKGAKLRWPLTPDLPHTNRTRADIFFGIRNSLYTPRQDRYSGSG